MLIPVLMPGYKFDNRITGNALQHKNFTYLNRNWRISEVLGEYHPNQTWYPIEKYDYYYNDINPTRIDSVKMYSYDTDSNEWTPGSLTEYIYDATGQYITQIVYIQLFGGVTNFAHRTLVEHDNQNRVTMWTREERDLPNLEWVISMRYQIFYNTNSISSTMMYTPHFNEEPVRWYNSVFTNDGTGRPVEITTQISADSLSWTDYIRNQINYHPDDTSTGLDFINEMGDFYYTYCEVGSGVTWDNAMVSEIIRQQYYNGWQNDLRETYTYDLNNKLAELVNMTWNNPWNNVTQALYTYDTNGNMIQDLESTWNGPTWGNCYRYLYTWEQSTANDDNYSPAISEIDIITSPNPFHNDVSIRINTKTTQPVIYSIYNAKGQLVRTINALTNTKADWDGRDFNNQPVSNGIYFIQADIKGKSKTIKALKLN